MADEVARLVAVMEAQLRGFTKGMEQAQRIADQRFGAIERRMNAAERVYSRGFQNIGRLATRFLSVAAITAFTRSVLRAADTLKDAADQIGVTTQELQELQFAARATGGSADSIARSLQVLNDRLGDAANGEGELAEIMRELNIPMGTATQVLNDLADATQNAATQSDKARIATAAFGRAGSQNISFLSQGRQGLKELADEAHRLNQVWDAETVERLDKLWETFNSAAAAITRVAATPISKILDGLTQFLTVVDQGSWPERLQALASFLSFNFVPLPDIAGEIERATQKSTELRAQLALIDKQLGEPNILPGTELTLRAQRLQTIIELSKQFNDIALKQKFDAPDVPRGGALPPPKSTESDEEKEKKLLEFLGLPDIPEGDAFMERYWQIMAEKAEAAQGRVAAEGRFDPRAITPGPTPTEAPVDISDVIGFGGPEIQELTEEFDFFTESAKDGLIDVGLAAVRGFDDAQAAAGRLLERLGDMILELGVLRPLVEAMFGDGETGSSGGFFGSLLKSFAGGFAQGGLIPRGQWGVVHDGEAVFSTSAGARVIPNTSMPSMATPMAGGNRASVIVNQNFSLDGAVGEQGMRAAMRQEAAAAAAGTFRAVRSALPGMMVEAHKRVL